jgi:two-component system nitrogen regulation response regulator GlnG
MHRNSKVWVVDDDRSIRWVLERALDQAGIQTECFDNGETLVRKLDQQQPDAIVSDIRMPGMDGLSLLSHIHEAYPSLPVIITTAHSDLDSAVESYQRGAFEYLPKPFDIEEVVAVTQRALAQSRENGIGPAAESGFMPTEIIGEAPAMQEVFRAIGRLSHSNITVLINGESGTGKELVARALHRHCPRSDNPFIALNMAAIPKDLMESELFGHEKGAFTGANSMRRGRCCGYWQTGNSTGSGGTPRCRSMSASSPPPTRTWNNWLRSTASGKISSTGSTLSGFTFPNWLSDAKTYLS